MKRVNLPVRSVLIVSALLIIVGLWALPQIFQRPPLAVQIPMPTRTEESYHPVLQLVQGGTTVDTGLTVWEEYFVFTPDCKSLYYSRGEEPSAAIGRYDVATGNVFRYDLPSLGSGTLYLPQISPDGRKIAWFNTHDMARGVVVMDIVPSVGAPHFVYDNRNAANVSDFRWDRNSQHIAVEFDLGSSQPYLHVRMDMNGQAQEITAAEWETYLGYTYTPSADSATRQFELMSPTGLFRVTGTMGDYGATQVSAECFPQYPLKK